MRRYLFWTLAVVWLLIPLAHQPGWAGKPEGAAADKEAIAKNAEAFVEAFHKGDATALASFWTPDGDFTDQTGHHLKGRKAIEKAFHTFFSQNKGLRVRINSTALRFLTPDVAVEYCTNAMVAP